MGQRRDRERTGTWANKDAEREFLQLYDALAAEHWQALRQRGWGAPPHEHDVDTGYGWTRAYHWEGDGPPVVLLPGAGTPSLMWVPLIGELVGRSVYAIDTLGDPGRSTQRAPLRDGADVAAWLDQVLNGLHLDAVQLVGASFGGRIAINHALRSPQRVERLVLLEPFLVKPRPLFWVHGIACGVALLLPGPLRRRAARPLHMAVIGTDDPRVRRIGFLGQAKFRRGMPRFAPVTDDEFAALALPTLLLLGAKSQLHRSRPLLERARRLMPNVEAELVVGAGHSLPVDQAPEVAARVRAFTARSRTG